MTWIIRWEETEISSDDFLIEDLESIEKATGQPWSILNPYRDVKVAKAFLAVALLRAGKNEQQIELALRVVSLGTLKTTFDYKPDDEVEVVQDETPTKRRKPHARTSRASSLSESATAGSPTTPGNSDSVTSS